jgi:hypothetical protein
VAGVVALSVGVPFIAPPHPFKDGTSFDQVLDGERRAGPRGRSGPMHSPGTVPRV